MARIQYLQKSIIVVGLALAAGLAASAREIDLKTHWDENSPLANPHKGWYHHFPDNHIDKYRIERDEDLLEFPGMDHLYIRLAWAYLEPAEGRFEWETIDSIIDKWVAHGLKIAFRISCKETSTDRIEQQFATPKWVMEAGAKGGFYRSGKTTGPDGPWEPVFDDPVFLEKLESFLRAFAKRYDGKPWVRYVDVGSIGDWGEGHTHSGSRLVYGYEARKRHIDLHLKYFTKSRLVVSDDFVYGVPDPDERERLHRYIVDQGLSYRDDSILVDWYIQAHTETSTVRSPQLFADVYKTVPTVLELEHYSGVKRRGNWTGGPDSTLRKFGKGKSGADLLRGALELLHATYIGYHGYAHEWLADNPDLTVELLNRCGYWYFVRSVDFPDQIAAGRDMPLIIVWENRGVAPAYHPYPLLVQLEGNEIYEFQLESNNQRWLPSTDGYRESYTIALPDALPVGDYTLKIKLFSPQEQRDVKLALDQDLLDGRNFYRIGTLQALGR